MSFNNCTIIIGTVSSNSVGIYSGTTTYCTITIETVSSDSVGISNSNSVYLYFTYIKCSAITSLSNTAGKLNVLNDTVFHAWIGAPVGTLITQYKKVPMSGYLYCDGSTL